MPVFRSARMLLYNQSSETKPNKRNDILMHAHTLATRRLTNKLLVLGAAINLCSCASFKTTQTDERTDAKTTVTTKASSWTFFDSKSSLSKWKATQSEKTQGASVGGLEQSASATNLVTITGSAVELGRMLRPGP